MAIFQHLNSAQWNAEVTELGNTTSRFNFFDQNIINRLIDDL